ncbi:hypothetical protein [Clostridioides difficile]|uniref:hypothetical protein n=1 Tax=Clostridioides difficile TaxID=1496 RepID=UPI001C15ED88|nr:hypothetical protein [Clostridioides difficile]MCU5872554.1 hypothetical protein [Clostridioides difficile]MCU5898877.1 hypothetical protein [Clostridioides difficile]HBF0283731.1 hypothetical protein [Clostridioides difficile]HBF6216173.1 hypothetical protein [Clostridioides difficile]HBF6482564.1 hypothetical protein [Clostridioides difficile]
MIEKLNENASLSDLITAFENSTNEIKTISNTLKQTLINKNIKVLDTDKLSSLVDKVDKLKAQEFGVRINKLDENPDTCVSYLGDAIGMTPASVGSYGSWDTIDFIRNIKPCGFKDGIVTKYIKKENFNMYEDGTNVEDDTDVMIEFPKFYWKIQSSDNYMDIFISKTKLDDDYECPAHLIGSTEKEFIYIGAYLAYLENSKLRSKKNVSPTIASYSSFKSISTKYLGYDILDHQCMLMLQILFIIIFKSIDCKKLGIGYGSYIGGHYKSNGINTGGSSFKGMLYGEQNGDEQIKFLGVEDLWGNYQQITSRCTATSQNGCICIEVTKRDGKRILSSIGRKVGVVKDVLGGTNTGFLVKNMIENGGGNPQDTRYYKCWANLDERLTRHYVGFEYSENSRYYGLFSSFFQSDHTASTRLIFIGEDNQNTLKTIQEDELLFVENEKVGGIL